MKRKGKAKLKLCPPFSLLRKKKQQKRKTSLFLQIICPMNSGLHESKTATGSGIERKRERDE
jgi:hypothetical protein